MIGTCTSLVFVTCFPWMFAYDRTNYLRYLPVYWCDMISLIDEHPSTHKSFQAGNFVVQLQAMHSVKWPLTRLSSRLLTEIQNRKGRIAGSSLNKGSVQRWLITSHERVVITQACRQMAGLSATNEECFRKEKGKIKDVS